jgi:hypothetical protein
LTRLSTVAALAVSLTLAMWNTDTSPSRMRLKAKPVRFWA